MSIDSDIQCSQYFVDEGEVIIIVIDIDWNETHNTIIVGSDDKNGTLAPRPRCPLPATVLK